MKRKSDSPKGERVMISGKFIEELEEVCEILRYDGLAGTVNEFIREKLFELRKQGFFDENDKLKPKKPPGGELGPVDGSDMFE